MSPRRAWLRRVGLATAGALVATAPVLLADEAGVEAFAGSDGALLAARAWADLLPDQSTPQLPSPGAEQNVILVLRGHGLARTDLSRRTGRRMAIEAQQLRVASQVATLGGSVTATYRALVNGMAVQIPAGRLASVAEFDDVVAVHPVTFLAPAQTGAGLPQPLPQSSANTPVTPSTGGRSPMTVALIDTGIHPEHPALGGAIGLDRLIIGGGDIVTGSSDPRVPAALRADETHGTSMASLVLNDASLRSLPPDRMPRLRAYRVVDQEPVGGRRVVLARSDRVLSAMERAVDPNQDGDLSDRSSVILLGVARRGSAGGTDPLTVAAGSADAIGALVVAPAGNSGPGVAARLGTVGAPGTSADVLTVGGLAAATAPRTATMKLGAGPASARFDALPLMGPAPAGVQMPVVVLAGTDGVSSGTDVRDYTDASGQSRVQGALVVVARGGGTILQKAGAAKQAGAAAIAIWDQDGSGAFPGVHLDGQLTIPVFGLGSRQGALLAKRPGLTASASADPIRTAGQAVAGFSAVGPAPNGVVGPAIMAPAVDVPAAFPGTADEPLFARVNGTSFAAAQVAALALRLLADNPDLSPADVRSLLTQAAAPIDGVPVTAQGAGVARPAVRRPIAIDPGVVGVRRVPGKPTTIQVGLHELMGVERQIRLAVLDSFGVPVIQPDRPVTLRAGGRAVARLTLPGADGDLSGMLAVVAPDNSIIAQAPLHISAPPAARVRLESPRVEVDQGLTQVFVTVRGPVGMVGGVHGLRLELVGSGPVRVLTAQKVVAEWPIGTYRFVVGARDVSGVRIRAGAYRIRVRATGADGRTLSAISRIVRIP